ncbi:MAG: alpha-1,2-fucosyltransferase [Gemmatimonadales bacterium]
MKAVLEVKFAGGLGNQLFQYATGRSLAHKNNVRYLVFNTDNYQNESLNRTFELGRLRVKGHHLRNRHFKNLFAANARLNRLAHASGLHKRIDENGFVSQCLQNKLGFLSSLYGYWQSETYFGDIRPELLEELIPLRLPPYPAWLGNKNTVGIHVRRTDYLQDRRYGVLGKEYYVRAIEFIRAKVEHPFFVFFSDDMPWCRATFSEDFLFFNEGPWAEDYLQLHLISKCRHQIIANSSFSWWAAWLNENESKIVVRPARPFREPSLLYENHYPASWAVVDNTP